MVKDERLERVSIPHSAKNRSDLLSYVIAVPCEVFWRFTRNSALNGGF